MGTLPAALPLCGTGSGSPTSPAFVCGYDSLSRRSRGGITRQVWPHACSREHTHILYYSPVSPASSCSPAPVSPSPPLAPHASNIAIRRGTVDMSTQAVTHLPPTPPSEPAKMTGTVLPPSSAPLQPAHKHIWLITGPAGCGKTSVAEFLRQSLSVPYLEGDTVRGPATISVARPY